MEFVRQWDLEAIRPGSDDVRALLGLWHARGASATVHPRAPEPVDLWCGPNLIVLLALPGDDFVYEHYGSAIAQTTGRDKLGRRASTFDDPLGEFLLDSYRAVAHRRAPLYARHRASYVKNVTEWEHLVLPYGGDSDPLRLLVYSHPMELAAELLHHILEACDDGIVALRAQRDDQAEISHFTAEVVNRTAERLLGLHAAEHLGNPFSASALSAERTLRAAVDTQRTVSTERTYGGRHFRVSLHPNGDQLVATMTDVTELRRALSRSQRLAALDPLTGALNRRALERVLGREFRRFDRYGHRPSLVLFDIDRFKRVNDRWGHAAGDAVLRAVADIVRRGLRDQDVLGRVGGEEFVVVLPETDLEAAAKVSERLRAAITSSHIGYEDELLSVTASFGVAAPGCMTDRWEQVLERADALMYTSKRNGRNRVSVDGAPDRAVLSGRCAG